MEEKEVCDNCYYFRAIKVNIMHYRCCRYPLSYEVTPNRDWCGEFKIKEAENDN